MAWYLRSRAADLSAGRGSRRMAHIEHTPRNARHTLYLPKDLIQFLINFGSFSGFILLGGVRQVLLPFGPYRSFWRLGRCL